jgi:hypothetical protein
VNLKKDCRNLNFSKRHWILCHLPSKKSEKISIMQLRRGEQMRSVFYDKYTTTESFWSCMYKHSETYKELAIVAILILSIFPTSVMCERSLVPFIS